MPVEPTTGLPISADMIPASSPVAASTADAAACRAAPRAAGAVRAHPGAASRAASTAAAASSSADMVTLVTGEPSTGFSTVSRRPDPPGPQAPATSCSTSYMLGRLPGDDGYKLTSEITAADLISAGRALNQGFAEKSMIMRLSR